MVMPAAAPRSNVPIVPPEGDLHLEADQFLAVMASLKRSARRLAGRPQELSSLTDAGLELVRLVTRRPGISVAQAADELQVAPNTVSTLVRQLTEQGFLVRQVDPDDRRVARLALSPTMERKVGAFRDRRVMVLAESLAKLPPARQRAFVNALTVLEEVAGDLAQKESAQ